MACWAHVTLLSRVLPLLFAGWAFAAPALAAPALAAPDDHGSVQLRSDEHVPGAAALEGKIIAPCCWNQTIDIHGSEISTELRTEIRRRLKAGESADAIEASLVERYGPKILAVPPGSRLGGAGIVLVLALGIAGGGAFMLLRKWQRRSAAKPGAKPPSEKRDALDDRLDAELANLDG